MKAAPSGFEDGVSVESQPLLKSGALHLFAAPLLPQAAKMVLRPGDPLRDFKTETQRAAESY